MAATDEAIMNQIKHEELFGNLKNFLKGRGIELQEGSYTKRVQQGCEVLADSINMSQRAFKRAKTAVDNGLDQLRQTIHEKTAPKSAAGEASAPRPAPAKPPRIASQAKATARKAGKTRARKG